ncbi:MAG: recombinase family protein, partial [Geminicoccaceae bacterium]
MVARGLEAEWEQRLRDLAKAEADLQEKEQKQQQETPPIDRNRLLALGTDLEVSLPRSRPATVRTDEDTINLVRRLAIHYPDAVIAGILNRQGRKTATGLRFTAPSVGSLRRYWNIPRFVPPKEAPKGDVVNVRKAARIFGMAPSTLHRWLNDGFIAGEQITPGAPWQI